MRDMLELVDQYLSDAGLYVKTPENCHKTVRIKSCACIFTLQ